MSADPPVKQLRRRLVLATAALSLVVAILLIVVVQGILEWTSGNSVDQLLADRANTVIRSIETRDREPVVPDVALVPGVAVYDEDGKLIAGSVPPSQRDEFDELSGRATTTYHQDDEIYRLVARPFAVDVGDAGRVRGVVVVSESLEPYESQEHNALLICIAAGSLIVALATGLAAWASKRALAPVAHMARTAREWGAHDLDRRFDLGPPTDEIRALGQTLDGLLDRVARAIADEQRLTSELAHELRTPLTAVQSTVELIAMRDDLDDDLRADLADLHDYCRAMASTISSLLELARALSDDGRRPRAPLADVLAEVLRQVRDPEKVVVGDTRGLAVAMPVEVAVRAVAPVVDNATRHGDHVAVTAATSADLVVITVRDDGPGLAGQATDELFRPGYTTGEGSGLGLALARRMARSVGGDVSVDPDVAGEHRGASFSIRLPREAD